MEGGKTLEMIDETKAEPTEATDPADEASDEPADEPADEPPNTVKIQAHIQKAAQYLAEEEMFAARAQDSLRAHWQDMLKAVAARTTEAVDLVKDINEGNDRTADLERLPAVLEHMGREFAAIGNDCFELLAVMGENRRISDSLRNIAAATSRPRRTMFKQ